MLFLRSIQGCRVNDLVMPVTRYAISGDINIAYQTMGEGPIDIIMVPGIVSHVECLHEFVGYTAFLRRLSSFARVVTFDKRGQGLSDRISGAASLEQRIDDVRAVMDAIGSEQAVLLGFSEGSPMSALFAATYPERVSKLVLFGGYAWADLPEEMIAQRVAVWGTGAMVKALNPDEAANPEAVNQNRQV
jgi:pimeloyl-ACP methyl ester carboxylesterase